MINVGIVVLLALLASQPNHVEYLQTVQNQRLAYILSNLQLLSESSPEQSKALRVRIFSVPEPGECGGTPQSCPKTELFVAVSGFDDIHDRRVYQLPKRHHWRFGQWLTFPAGDGPTDYAEFTLEADDPSSHPAATWWRPIRYHLKVNYRDGTFTTESAG
jgi:hypothetical protein